MFGLTRLTPLVRTTVHRVARRNAHHPPLGTQATNGALHMHGGWSEEKYTPIFLMSEDRIRWQYRAPNTFVSPKTRFKSEAIMALMWYWVLYHVWYDWDHLVGHHPYPDPSKWTDAELGIQDADED